MKIEVDAFNVEFPFDGLSIESEVAFVESGTLLVGTALLANHHLEIDFPEETVSLKRAK